MNKIVHSILAMLLVVLGLCVSVGSYAQVRTVKPVRTTEGYDFYVAWMPNGGSKPSDMDLKLQLLVSSRDANKVRLEYSNGASIDYDVPAGETTVIDVDAANVYWDPAKDEEEKVLNKGVRIYSIERIPMTVYAVNQIGEIGTFSFDGAHVLPEEALGSEYLVQSASNDAIATEFVIMSTRPGNTNVAIDLKTNSRKGVQHLDVTFTKSKQIYIVRSKSADPNNPNDLIDLSGSMICADAPVAVWSGNQYAIIPNKDGFSTDFAVDQLLPVNKWGKEFIIPLQGMKMQMNEVHIVSMEDGTNVTLQGTRGGAAYTQTRTLASQEKWQKSVLASLGGHLLDSTLVVQADKPIQVYLYSSSAANNPYDKDGDRHMQGDPAMTLISPLEYLTDTTIFSTYEAGDKNSTHQLVLWAKQSVLGSLQLDGQNIGGQFTKRVNSMPNYRYAHIDIQPGTHILTAADRGFGGYITGVNDGQAYIYPAGYTFLPFMDSLYLSDPHHEFLVHRSEWSKDYPHNGGWHLDRDELSNGNVILDSIFVCDSTELTFPLKMYNDWDVIRWEIVGSIRKSGYFTPVEQQYDPTKQPELTHQFVLLPSSQNRQSHEDFEVRAIVYHRPLVCDAGNPNMWQKDTLNTIVRVLRAYNDTTWKAVCSGEVITFFRDTTERLGLPTGTQEWYETTFNYETHDPQNGLYKYQLGENIITRHYTSVGGCDSLSTLCLYVCPSYENEKKLSVCADDLYGVGGQFGDYFQDVNFMQSYEKKDAQYWTQQPDGTWLFTGSSKLKATGCLNSTDFDRYAEKVSNFKGCDSILNLELTVIPVTEYVTHVYQCEDTYAWKDQNNNVLETIVYDPTKHKKNHQLTFKKSLPYTHCPSCPSAGCDSVRHTLFLTFVDSEGIKKEIRLCQGETSRYETDGHVWEFDSKGKLCNMPYEQQPVTFTTPEGCEYDYTVIFIVDSVYNLAGDTIVYCWEKGDRFNYQWSGHKNFLVKTPTNQTYQLGFDADEIVLDNVGTYVLTDSLTTHRGCDSVWTQVIVLAPKHRYTIHNTISDEQWMEWEGRILAGEKAVVDNPNSLPIEVYPVGKHTIVDSLQTVPVAGYSCDSIRILNLTIGAVFRDTTYDATCSNCDTYKWEILSPTGTTKTVILTDLPEAGEQWVYYDSMQTVLGFDSIYVRYLTGYPSYEYIESTTICQGEEYVWNGHMEGDNGWLHNLTINGQPITSIPTNKAGVFTVRDEMKTHEMIFINPKTGEEKNIHCDSIHTLTLHICKTYNHLYNTEEVTDYVDMKSNEMMTHFDDKMLFVGCDYDWQQSPYTEAELRAQYEKVVLLPEVDYWLDSVSTISQCGCDSNHYVNIHICKLRRTTLLDSIGDNNTTWQFGGNELDANGNPIHTQPLVTGEMFHYYDDGTPVDYSANKDATIREYHFVDTLITEEGCDSIVYATVLVYPTYRFEEDTAICSNVEFNWHGYKELNHTHSGLVYDRLLTQHGFDSIYVLDLTIIATYEEHAYITLCMNDTLRVQNYDLYYEDDKFKDVIVLRYEKQEPEDGKLGCDSIYYFHMTYNPAYGYEGSKYHSNWVDTAYVCQYEHFRWIDKNGNEHTQNLRDSLGNKYETIPTDKIGYITIYDSLKTVGCACDSIHTLVLYVNEAFQQRDTLYGCTNDTLRWHMKPDTIYTYQGTADLYDTIPGIGVNGCDSSYYLHIHYDLSYDMTNTVKLCSDDISYQWEDIVFDSLLVASREWDTIYHEVFIREYSTTLSGCDSVMRLDITIAPSRDSMMTDTICAGETYMFFDQPLTSPGKYQSDQPNKWGCYTHYYLTLVEYEPTRFVVQPEPICVDEDGLANTYILHYTYSGNDSPVSYSVRYDSSALAIGFQNQESIPIPSHSSMEAGKQYALDIPVPRFNRRDQYPRPGYYQAEVAFDNGICLSDSVMTYSFEMEMRYPAWITQQHWNDAILIMDSTQNGGYVFSAYQWYRDGEILHGETRPYLFAPDYLEDGAEYMVALTRVDDGVTVLTCPIVPDLSKHYDNSPTQTYISVVPTVVAKENPVVYIMSPTNGSYKLYNSQGQLIKQGQYVPNEHNAGQVELPTVSGVYVFHLVESTTANTGTDLRRTVKVVVQ